MQSKPNRTRCGAGRKVRQWQRPVKRRCTSRRFEAITGHHFQRTLAQCKTICRDQNVCVALRDCETTNEQTFEIVLDLKCLSSRRTRKGRGVEDDGVEFFASPGEPWQHGSHVVQDKAMIDR